MIDTQALRDAISGWEQGARDENISLDDRLEQGYALAEAAQALLAELDPPDPPMVEISNSLGNITFTCPHEGCGGTSMAEVNRDDEWDEVTDITRDGNDHYIGQASAPGCGNGYGYGDYEGIGWVCVKCGGEVSLPDIELDYW